MFFASDVYSESKWQSWAREPGGVEMELTHCKEWPDLVQPDKLGLNSCGVVLGEPELYRLAFAREQRIPIRVNYRQ